MFKINVNELMKQVASPDLAGTLVALSDCVRAIFYFLEAGEFRISDEAYMKMDDSGKKYFIKTKD